MNITLYQQVFACTWHLSFYSDGWKEDKEVGIMENEPIPANESWTRCVTQIHSFTSTFLFSVETQHTIGKFSIKSYHTQEIIKF